MEQIAIMLTIYVINALLAKAPESTATKGTIDDVSVPVPDEGTKQGVVFGDVWQDSMQVLWFGNFRTRKVKTSSGK